ncbi:MAG: Gfo/Idh/MocA family oxidoreductase, partial [Bacteroidaceae bacterium]|nr:Gfo/Idh/MocA family oxidoreductase [Bacteroidaceae bacterium]
MKNIKIYICAFAMLFGLNSCLDKYPEDAILEGTIESGYHVLLEKPIAQTLEECLTIGEAARKKGVLVSVCHVLRYHPYFMKIKELVESGELGHIISI